MADLDLDSSLSLSSRRRSSAHYKPPSAPPSLPIPDPPRPSPNLAAVAAYSQSRAASVDDLSDPPPQSILTSSRLSSNHHHQQMTHHHLSVPDLDRPSESRSEHKAPSSRKALTRALELAREAVQLDSTNDNPELAVAAYAKSVALLSEVMERVRRGEDTTESTSRRKNGRRRSVVAQEEEVRRLQNIVSLPGDCLFTNAHFYLARYLCRSHEYPQYHIQYSPAASPCFVLLFRYYPYDRVCPINFSNQFCLSLFRHH